MGTRDLSGAFLLAQVAARIEDGKAPFEGGPCGHVFIDPDCPTCQGHMGIKAQSMMPEGTYQNALCQDCPNKTCDGRLGKVRVTMC